MGVFKRGHIYWMRFMIEGDSYCKSTGKQTRAEAMEVERQVRAEIDKGRTAVKALAARLDCETGDLALCLKCEKPFRPAREGERLCSKECRQAWAERQHVSPPLGVFLDGDFMRHVRATKADKPNTLYGYNYRVNVLLASDLADKPLDEITPQQIDHFVAANRHLSVNSLNAILRVLGRAFNLAVKWGKLTKMPPEITAIPGGNQRERTVSDEELACYLDACDPDWRDVATLIRYEGLRPSEAMGLAWARRAGQPMDPRASGFVVLEETGGYLQILRGKSKTARRKLPLATEAFDALSHRFIAAGQPRNGFVFTAPGKNGRMTDQGKPHRAAFARLNRACAEFKAYQDPAIVAAHTGFARDFVDRHLEVFEAGIPYFDVYTLRHTCLTRLGERGVPAFTLMHIAGTVA